MVAKREVGTAMPHDKATCRAVGRAGGWLQVAMAAATVIVRAVVAVGEVEVVV